MNTFLDLVSTIETCAELMLQWVSLKDMTLTSSPASTLTSSTSHEKPGNDTCTQQNPSNTRRLRSASSQLTEWLDRIRQHSLQCDLLLKKQRPIVRLPPPHEPSLVDDTAKSTDPHAKLLSLAISVAHASYRLWQCLHVVTALFSPAERKQVQAALNRARVNFAKVNVRLNAAATAS